MPHMNINSHSKIEKLWPSRAAFSDAIGVSSNVTRKWYDRNRIPPEYWVRVINACHEIDAPVTFKLLAELIDEHKKTPSRKE